MPKISDGVVVTVPIVVLLVAVAAGVFAVARDQPPGPQQNAAAVPFATPTDTPTPTPLPAVTPTPTRTPTPHHTRSAPATPVVPTATATTCVDRVKHRELSVLTFNIHSARTENGSVHVDTIGDEIARWQPDIVLLQEVDRGRDWSRRIDMPAVLAARLGMTWAFGANVSRSPTNQYGTAILSRFPIESSGNVALPAPGGTQQRGLLHAVVDVRGVPLSIYDTHLENTSDVARVEQIRAIVPILRADSRAKLLGGDFNAVPTSTVLATARSVLADTWMSVGSGPSLTAPAGNPRVRIDYLLYGDGSGVDIAPQAAEILPSQVSDHRAVRATYAVTASAGEVCVPVLEEQGTG